MQHADEGQRQGGDQPASGGGDTRVQQGGEGGTTRFGMEEGDNTDIPATGGPDSDDDEDDGA